MRSDLKIRKFFDGFDGMAVSAVASPKIPNKIRW
jgi:hypothetical protein